MDNSIYLVGKHDICTVLSHFFKKSNVLVSSQAIKNLSNLIKEQIPESSITIIILSSDNKVELPPAYQPGERVVSCLLLDTVEEANQWVALQKSLPSQQKTNISILAQWHPHYLKLANSWLKVLKTQPKINVNNWMADTVGKTRLLDYLQKNIQTCLYFGHGRPQKIVAYHGISADEIIQTSSIATIACFISFSCFHLHHDSHQPSFGEILIKSHKVATFWGSRIATDKILNAKLGKICQLQFLEANNITINDWIKSIGVEIKKDENSVLRPLWESYSLLGNPL